MASWKEERDRLVAQTLAFVQQVAAAHPAAKPDIDMQHDLSDQPAPAPAGDVEGPIPAPVTTTIAGRSATNALFSAASDRAEILQRVTAFKARQSQMSREREAYYEAMQARIRTSLGNECGRDRL